MPDIHYISRFEPKASHNYFIDANMLLYLFAPIGNYKIEIQEKIGRFIQNARKTGAGLVVTSMVISEFYNKNLKDAFGEWQQKQSDGQQLDLKKHYRKSKDYVSDLQAIQSAVKAILKLTTPLPDDFNSVVNNIDTVFRNAVHADFNDAYFLTQANEKKWMMLSNDKDIINHPNRQVDVITSLSL